MFFDIGLPTKSTIIYGKKISPIFFSRVTEISAQMDDITVQEKSFRHTLQLADQGVSKLEEIFLKNHEIVKLMGHMVPGFDEFAQSPSRQ